VRIVFLDEDRYDRGYIGVHGNMVLGQVRIHRTAGPLIHDGMLMQGERYAPNHSATELAAHQTWINDPSRSEGTDQPGNAYLSEIGIDLDLGEHGPMGMHGVARLRGRIGRRASLTRAVLGSAAQTKTPTACCVSTSREEPTSRASLRVI